MRFFSALVCLFGGRGFGGNKDEREGERTEFSMMPRSEWQTPEWVLGRCQCILCGQA